MHQVFSSVLGVPQLTKQNKNLYSGENIPTEGDK